MARRRRGTVPGPGGMTDWHDSPTAMTGRRALRWSTVLPTSTMSRRVPRTCVIADGGGPAGHLWGRPAGR